MLRSLSTLALLIVITSQAGANPFLGALSGAAQGFSDSQDEQRSVDAQRRLSEQRHRQEMERMRLHYDLERQRIADQAAARHAADRAREEAGLRQVEIAHPGWRFTIRTKTFGAWLASVPDSIRRLADSDAPSDAIMLLDFYKTQHRDWATLQ